MLIDEIDRGSIEKLVRNFYENILQKVHGRFRDIT